MLVLYSPPPPYSSPHLHLVELTLPLICPPPQPSFSSLHFHNLLSSPHPQEWDEAVLESLRDIRVVYPDEKGFDFILEFHFADNDYFTNKVCW